MPGYLGVPQLILVRLAAAGAVAVAMVEGGRRRGRSPWSEQGTGTGTGTKSLSITPHEPPTTLPLISSASQAEGGTGLGVLASSSMTLEPPHQHCRENRSKTGELQKKKERRRTKGPTALHQWPQEASCFRSARSSCAAEGTIGHRPMVLTLLAPRGPSGRPPQRRNKPAPAPRRHPRLRTR